MNEDKKPRKPWHQSIPFQIVVWGIPIVFGLGIAWAAIKDVPQAHAKMEAKIADVYKTVNENDKRVSVVEREIYYIRKGIDEIKEAVKK